MTVEEQVLDTLASVKHIPVETVKLNSQLQQELGIDSLDVISVVFELENAFHITLPDGDVRQIKTPQDIVDGIKKLQEEGEKK
jgi:acyl carrier protein